MKKKAASYYLGNRQRLRCTAEKEGFTKKNTEAKRGNNLYREGQDLSLLCPAIVRLKEKKKKAETLGFIS